MRDFIIVCTAAAAIAATFCWVKWRTGTIYQETQDQYELELEK